MSRIPIWLLCVFLALCPLLPAAAADPAAEAHCAALLTASRFLPGEEFSQRVRASYAAYAASGRGFAFEPRYPQSREWSEDEKSALQRTFEALGQRPGLGYFLGRLSDRFKHGLSIYRYAQETLADGAVGSSYGAYSNTHHAFVFFDIFFSEAFKADGRRRGLGEHMMGYALTHELAHAFDEMRPRGRYPSSPEFLRAAGYVHDARGKWAFPSAMAGELQAAMNERKKLLAAGKEAEAIALEVDVCRRLHIPSFYFARVTKDEAFPEAVAAIIWLPADDGRITPALREYMTRLLATGAEAP